MASGLQFFDASTGNLRLSLSDRLFKFFGIAQIGNSYTGSASSGTIVDSRFTAYPSNQWFAFVVNGSIDPDGNAPEFSLAGNTLTWSFPRSVSASAWTRPNTTFVYGIY